jgi:BirA family biotin operon repressor/biotin-[acetyl-CoA-carboxylase] ligase
MGKNMLFLPEVDSTNTYAMDLLRNVNVLEGTIIYTHNQTEGKGQRGSVWLSEASKNMTLSAILLPKFLTINQSFYLSKIAAIASYDLLAEILNPSQYDIKIKWPNDILVNKKKIAGILIENNFNGDHILQTVIGIGLNVNQEYFFELNSTATSIKIESGNDYEIQDIIELFCSKLEKWYLKLKENKFEFIQSTYMAHLYGIFQVKKFEDHAGHPFLAEIVNVEENGKLTLKDLNNQLASYDIKEIKLTL